MENTPIKSADDDIIRTIKDLTRSILDESPKKHSIQRERITLEILEAERFESYLKEDVASIVMREVVSDKHYTPLLRWLVKDKNADINHRDKYNRTILVNGVAWQYDKSLIHTMLALGADIYRKGPLNMSPLLYAFVSSEAETALHLHAYYKDIHQMLLTHAKSLAKERHAQQSHFIHEQQYQTQGMGYIKTKMGFFTPSQAQPKHYWKRHNEFANSAIGPGNSNFGCAEIGRIVTKPDLRPHQKKWAILKVL